MLKCILLVSVCIIAINGRYYESSSRRSNELLDSLLNKYRISRRNYNKYDDDNNRSYKRSAHGDNDENVAMRKGKLYNLVDDLVQYTREKRQHDFHVRSDTEFLRNSIENRKFHEDDNKDVDGLDEANSVEEPVTSTQDIRMPNVAPKERDTYLCYGVKLPDDDRYITKFEPVADMHIAHHMLLFGCETPFKKNVAWQCREMQPVCGSGSQAIKYAWGKNAPALEMPNNVGVHVGGISSIKYLVVQVHYLNVDKFKDGKTKDRSGLSFTMTSKRPKYFAGIYLIAAGWPPIPAHKERFHMDMGCLYNGEVKFSPFRFRVHAHKLGAVITGYRVRDGNWSLIGRGDPQRAQAFYKVFSDIDIQNGDKVIGRCTFNSTTRDKTTYIGATHSDEMCNFYIMYFYDADKYGNNEQLPCQQVDLNKLKYPMDSDVTLAEAEKKNSLAIHKRRHGLHYEQVSQWPKDGEKDGDLPIPIGQIAGVDFANNGNEVLFFHRGSRSWKADTFNMFNNLQEKYRTPISEKTLVWLSTDTGSVTKTAGANMFYLPHGVTVDHEKNIWVTDVGSHQVMKLSADGATVLLTLGEKFINGNDDEHFCKPTDIAISKTGDFFVGDGYCNSRVLKFDSTGRLIMKIDSSKLTSVSPSNMYIVHSLALDDINNKLYVADRENKRVLVFDSNTGKLLYEIANNIFDGAVYAVAYHPAHDGILHVINENYADTSKVSGFTYSLKGKKIVATWKPLQGFNKPHDLAVSKDNKYLIATEIGPNKIWKFERKEKARP